MLFLVLNLCRFLHTNISFSIFQLYTATSLCTSFDLFHLPLHLEGRRDCKDFAGSWRESLATVICTTNCAESLRRRTNSFSTQISTIPLSRALPFFNCAPFPIGFQCGAYLPSYNAPDFTIVKILHRKSTSSASFTLFILPPSSRAPCARLESPRSRRDIDHH
jgi:hypothetical protein